MSQGEFESPGREALQKVIEDAIGPDVKLMTTDEAIASAEASGNHEAAAAMKEHRAYKLGFQDGLEAGKETEG